VLAFRQHNDRFKFHAKATATPTAFSKRVFVRRRQGFGFARCAPWTELAPEVRDGRSSEQEKLGSGLSLSYSGAEWL